MTTTTHGYSYIEVDNSHIQQAIAEGAHSDTIAKLKANVAFNCVVGFSYGYGNFKDLANLLTYDVGFSNFQFKHHSTATFNREKHHNPHGLVRGVHNIVGGCTWVWLDVDTTIVSDTEMHSRLSSINHHIARTSDKSNPYKYRVIVELDKEVVLTREEWKPFINSISRTIGVGKIDLLAMSQVIYGYHSRNVLSECNTSPLQADLHLSVAKSIVAAKEAEEAIIATTPGEASAKLANPYSTFSYAYEAQIGDRWKTSMAAIQEAKRLGAPKEYIQDLMYSINDFLDAPKSRQLVRDSLFSAI